MARVRRTLAVVLCLAALAVRGHAASADADLQALLAALAQSDDPAGRLTQVPKLAAYATAGAATALSNLVKHDPDLRVREAAATALGETRAPNALDLLLDRAKAGGSQRVRLAIGRALARRPGSGAEVLSIVENAKASEVERALLIHVLEAYRDDASRAVLLRLAREESPAVREAAMRVLARRKDAPEQCRLAMIELLSQAKNLESTLIALDAFEPAAHGDMRPMVERIGTSLEPQVQEAAAHFLDLIRTHEAAEGKAAPPAAPGGAGGAPGGDRYADPNRDPEGFTRTGETPRARYDIVYVLDVTGSTWATLPILRKRILEEATLIGRLGASIRVGVVAYRDGPVAPDQPRAMEILPPTFSQPRLEQFLEKLKSGGVDTEGAAVAGGLREALDRTSWRWDARREVQLLADSKCDDVKAAAATVGFHFRADCTRTRIAYVLRTRTVAPPEFHDLARLGGTGVPELLK